jgi:flavin reductase
MRPHVAPLVPAMPEPVSMTDYRACMGRFPTGVTVLTAGTGAAVCGVTVSSFMSVSLRPPLVAAGLNTLSRFLSRLECRTGFVVNILADDQAAVARRFAAATRPDGPAGFAGLSWRSGPCTGAPLLSGAAGWLECHVIDLVMAGDHHIVIGAVDRVAVGEGAPLVHHASNLCGLGAAAPRGPVPPPHGATEPQHANDNDARQRAR